MDNLELKIRIINEITSIQVAYFKSIGIDRKITAAKLKYLNGKNYHELIEIKNKWNR
jgi:hypothetical protein